MYQTYPVYIPSARYARENDEIVLWRESFKINKECRDFINEKAAPAYHDRKLPEFITELTDTFGLERSMFVMARFVVAADWDKRYDNSVRERAERFDFQDMKESRALYETGQDPHRTADRTADLYSNVHPCILNDAFRRQMKLEQEQVNLPQTDISEENERDEGVEI